MLVLGFAQADGAANDLHAAGVQAFKDGQFVEAIRVWSQAYDLTPLEDEQQRSALSKDIAIAYRQVGDIASAIIYYERCRSDWPGRDYESAAAIRAWILANEAKAKTPTTSTDQYEAAKRTAFGVTLALAAVVVPLFTAIAFTSMRGKDRAA